MTADTLAERIEAFADGLLAKGLPRERLTVVADVVLCADTVVHIRRAHGWSAAEYRSLIVDTLAALTRPHA